MIDLNLTNDNPANPLAIYQGATYKSLVFLHPDDFSLWTPRGQIRTNWLHLGGQLLANFVFEPLTWGLVTIDGTPQNRTTIVPVIPFNATTLIPATKSMASGGLRVGRDRWVYDIELVSPTNAEVVKLSRGLVEVLPEATG